MDTLNMALLAGALEDEDDENERGTVMKDKNGEAYVSPVLKGLIGREVIISGDNLNDESARVLDVDAVWISLCIHAKKGDATYIERIDSIDEIRVI